MAKKSKTQINEEFAEFADELLAEFVAARGVALDLCGVRWFDALEKLRKNYFFPTRAQFLRALFDYLRDRCKMRDDDEVMSAFCFEESWRPIDTDPALAEAAQKAREAAAKLEAEADAAEREVWQREQRAESLRGEISFVRERIAYFRDTLPAELAAIVAACDTDAQRTATPWRSFPASTASKTSSSASQTVRPAHAPPSPRTPHASPSPRSNLRTWKTNSLNSNRSARRSAKPPEP